MFSYFGSLISKKIVLVLVVLIIIVVILYCLNVYFGGFSLLKDKSENIQQQIREIEQDSSFEEEDTETEVDEDNEPQPVIMTHEEKKELEQVA